MKIGFFGGGFDPFHSEHKKLLLSAIKELNLDKVVVYPSCMPPHKKNTTPFEYRFLIAKSELSDLNNVIVDDIENNGNINPAFVVIPKLKNKYPANEYYYIVGGDSILNFPKWIHPELIAKEVILVVAAREKSEQMLSAVRYAENTFNAKIIVLPFVGEQISGSLVRTSVAFGDKPNGISDETYRLIKNFNMYSEYSSLVEKLKNNIPQRTFEHIKRTVFYALKLNSIIGLDYGKVFTAALLHDCAKHLHRPMQGVPPAVEHQFLGAEYAEKEYLINDKDVLNAIECHTTGKPNMTELDKLIFCADMLEEGRSYPGVENLRQIIENDFHKGFIACINSSMNKLIEDGKPFHPLTKACVEYYNEKEINKEIK